MSFIYFTYRFLCYLWDTIIKRKAFFACLTLIKQVRCSRPLLIANCPLFSFFCLGNVKVVATAYVCFKMGWNSFWNSWIILLPSASLTKFRLENLKKIPMICKLQQNEIEDQNSTFDTCQRLQSELCHTSRRHLNTVKSRAVACLG